MPPFMAIGIGVVFLVLALVGYNTGKLYVGSKKALNSSTVSRDEDPGMFYSALWFHVAVGVAALIYGLMGL